MQREIKFRGKDFTGTWWVGDLTHDQNGNPLISKPKYGMQVYVVEESIGQYTGLKDRNGKEVYEGDVIKSELKPCTPSADPTPIFGVVEWWEEKAKFVINCTYSGDCRYATEFAIKGEVVGNIIDNPEIKKGGEYGL